MEQALPTCPPLPGLGQAVEMVFCFLQGHTQLLQYDPIADSSLLASGLGFDHLVPGCSTILGESPSFTLPPPLLSSCQSPDCVPVMVEMIPAFCQASSLSAAAVPQGLASSRCLD